VSYVLGRTLALARPELAFTQRLAPERLEAVVQAAASLVVPNMRLTADPRAVDAERRQMEKLFTEPVRAALAKSARTWLATATPNDVRQYVEGAELTAARAGLLAAGECEPVQRMVSGETGGQYRVPLKTKLRELVVFAASEDLHALRISVGLNVEIPGRR
jgi:hypothetical protein